MNPANRNNFHSNAKHAYRAITDPVDEDTTSVIGADAVNEELFMRRVFNVDGTTDTSDAGEMSLKLADLHGKVQTEQEIGLCVQGTRMFTIIPMVTPYPTSVSS